MQNNKQIFSPIKQRILYFVDYLKITKRDFYAKTGISRGTLESNTGITEDTLLKFFATYGEKINVEWIVVGKGEMLRNDIVAMKDEVPDQENKEKYMTFLEDEVSRLVLDNTKKQELIDAFMSGEIILKK